MRNKIALGAVLALSLPGVALAQETTEPAPTPKESASDACRAERAKVGEATFRATYGTNKNKRNAFGKCVSKRTGEAKTATTEAKNTCKAEQDADAAAFAQKYGTNKNKKNAFGKCVSGQSKAAMAEQTKTNVSASKACREERSKDAAAFAAKYGTNKNKANAFGKCVSKTAKALEQEAPAAA